MRSDKIDVRALLQGERDDANYTPPVIRRKQLKRVLAYWPLDLLAQVRDGFVEPPPWRLLYDPVQWTDVKPEVVHDYVRGYLTTGHWPTLDGLRRRFGRVSNHRKGDEVPEQESLPL